LIVATKSRIVSLDPAKASRIGEQQLLSALGDPLYAIAADGRLEPRLASGLPQLSADGLRARIPLRRGVRFHDGTPFDAAAMVFSLQRFLAIGTLSYQLRAAGYIKGRLGAVLLERLDRSAVERFRDIRLREGDVDDASLAQDIRERGGADLVVMARVLHHAARPQDAIAAATRLLSDGGQLLLVDYLPHDDEAMREQGDVWLGFEPAKLRAWLEAAALVDVTVTGWPGPLPSLPCPALQLAAGRKPARLVH
jgi:SAM-dependent methyltransferase